MPHPDRVKHSGTIGDVFGHRFVLEMRKGNILADIGPKGVEHFRLKTGRQVNIEGKKTPSEVKVRSISRSDGKTVVIDHPKHSPEQTTTDLSKALRAVKKAGFDAIGEPRRKPRHFEILARNSNGTEVELHVELDGHIRKRKKLLAA